MWIRRSHLLAPLARLVKDRSLEMGEVEAKAFRDMKKSYVGSHASFP
jgi:hypothetical protein